MSQANTQPEEAARRGIIDLTLPVVEGMGRFGLDTEFDTPITFDEVNWQGSVFRMFAHTGTHIDAPIHFIRDGLTIDQAPLDRLIGRGLVFDLSAKGDSEAIDSSDLKSSDPGIEAGDIAVLQTDWTDKHWGTSRFVEESPYLTPDGAQWLVDQSVKAIVYDFSEEFVVRNPNFRGEQGEVHHIILGSGVWNIEYVKNLAALQGAAVTIVALPLMLTGLDGSPARVIALKE